MFRSILSNKSPIFIIYFNNKSTNYRQEFRPNSATDMQLTLTAVKGRGRARRYPRSSSVALQGHAIVFFLTIVRSWLALLFL